MKKSTCSASSPSLRSAGRSSVCQADRHLGPKLTEQRCKLVRREVGIEHAHEVPRDLLLLRKQGPPRGLRARRREHGLETQLAETGLDLRNDPRRLP